MPSREDSAYGAVEKGRQRPVSTSGLANRPCRVTELLVDLRLFRGVGFPRVAAWTQTRLLGGARGAASRSEFTRGETRGEPRIKTGQKGSRSITSSRRGGRDGIPAPMAG